MWETVVERSADLLIALCLAYLIVRILILNKQSQ